MSGFDIRLLFTLAPRDSTLQYKRCVHFEITFLASPLPVHKYDEKDSVNSVKLSLKSHPEWVTLYIKMMKKTVLLP